MAAQVNAPVMNIVEKISAFKLQTRALQDLQAGDVGGATQKLQSAVTRLLNQGELELAQTMQQAGVLITTLGIEPPETGATVRPGKGSPFVQNGPYADTKEQLGGYYLVEVPDLDAALAWAARCPGASHGTIEVRPVWPTQNA